MKGARLFILVALVLGVAAGSAAAVGSNGHPNRKLPAVDPPPTATLVRVTITPRSGSLVEFVARSYENLGLSTGGTGAHEYVPLVVSRGIDLSTSPRLARLFASGEALSTVQLDVLDSTGALLFSYRLTDAWVAVYRHVSATAGVMEDVGFGFRGITYTFGSEAVSDSARISLDRIQTTN